MISFIDGSAVARLLYNGCVQRLNQTTQNDNNHHQPSPKSNYNQRPFLSPSPQTTPRLRARRPRPHRTSHRSFRPARIESTHRTSPRPLHNSTPSVRITNQPPIEVVPPLPRILTCAHARLSPRANTHLVHAQLSRALASVPISGSRHPSVPTVCSHPSNLFVKPLKPPCVTACTSIEHHRVLNDEHQRGPRTQARV